MKIRKLEERRGLERPDRSNASWQKSNEKKCQSAQANAPQQVPAKPYKNRSKHQKQAPVVEQRRARKSRKGVWTDGSSRVEAKAPKWLIFTLALVSLFILGALLLSFLKNRKEVAETSPSSVPEQTMDDEIAAMNLTPVEGPLPHVVAMAFAKTDDVNERLKHCLDPERIATLLPNFPPQAVSEVGVSGKPMGEVIAGDLSIERYQTRFANGDARILFVVRTDDGPKVDWEAYARHSRALTHWLEETENPSIKRTEESAEVRIQAIPDSYYNFRFADERLWRAYRLTSPDLEQEAVTAYAAAGSVTERILTRELTAEKRMTLQLKSHPDDARRRQFEIEKVLAVGWVKSKGDFEARWQRENSD